MSRAGRSEQTFPPGGNEQRHRPSGSLRAVLRCARFVDKQISHLAASSPELKRNSRRSSGRLFSLRDGEDQEFLEYLDQIEVGATPAPPRRGGCSLRRELAEALLELLARKT